MPGLKPTEAEPSIFHQSDAEAANKVQPAAIATLVNEHAYRDVERFISSLAHWTTEIPLFIWTTTELVSKLNELVKATKYSAPVHIQTKLDPYANMTRQFMERAKSHSIYPNLFYDFTLEKISLMEWALASLTPAEAKRGVLFCDADIFWFATPPSVPIGMSLAVSPHEIRRRDEFAYGVYNAGFLWTNSTECLALWRDATRTSRFFEQASIEDIVQSLPIDKVHFFGSEVNYGWWRMFQSDHSVEAKQAEWSIYRQESAEHSPLFVKGQPLCCVHTHFTTTDPTTQKFNEFLLKKLTLLKKDTHCRSLQKSLGK